MEIALIIITALVTLFATFSSLKDKNGKILLMGWLVIFLSVAALILAIISKYQSYRDEEVAKETAAKRAAESYRGIYPIEPIDILYKTEVNLIGLSKFSPFVALADSLEKHFDERNDEIYIDSNDEYFLQWIASHDHHEVVPMSVYLIFSDSLLKEFNKPENTFFFLSNFFSEDFGKKTQELKMEITYKKYQHKFEIVYISRHRYNLRKYTTPSIIGLPDLPKKYIVCEGFNAQGLTLKSIKIETGINRLETNFDTLAYSTEKGYYFHQIKPAEINHQ